MKIDWPTSRTWRPARVIKRTAWAVVSALATLLLLSFYSHPLGANAGIALAGLAVLAALRPYEALLLLAAFGPLATILLVASGIEARSLRLVEALPVAYLSGWAGRHVVTSEPLAVPRALRWSAAALILAALASGVISGAVVLTEHGGDTTWRLLDDLFRWYAVHTDAVAFAMIFAEGVLLLLAVADTCAANPVRRDGVVRMMVIGAAAAASFNLLRIVVDGALPREQPWREFLSLFTHLRVNVHHGDLNAAGSYFAMLWFLSLGFAARAPRAGGACLLLISAGLWMAGSRVALAATLVIAAMVVADRLARRGKKWVAGIVALLVIATAVAAILAQSPLRHRQSDASLALRIRMGLATGAIAMAADHPVFGAGLGRFYDLSDRYVRVPNYIVRENAHNNFLQILAELGVPGLVLFLAILGTTLAAARHAVDQSTWPLVAGICAFLLTCIGGHPLLVPHVAFPFWMALGVAASSSAVPGGGRGIGMAALVLAGMFVVTLPSRTLAAVRGANVEHTSVGFSMWQRDASGARYRWAGGRATFYVPSSARAVRIPLRHGTEGPETLEVRIFLEGREADRVPLRRGDEWRTARLVLGKRVEAPFLRIDLEAWIPGAPVPLDAKPSGFGGVLMVGRPEFEHPRDVGR